MTDTPVPTPTHSAKSAGYTAEGYADHHGRPFWRIRNAHGMPITEHISSEQEARRRCAIYEQNDAVRADRLASEMARRVESQQALGRPSFYNIAREVLIEEFAAEHNGDEYD